MQALGGIVGGLIGLGSAKMGADASKEAAQVQSQAAQQVSADTLARYYQTRNDLLPFLTGSQSALTSLQNMTGTGEGGNPLLAPYTRMFTPKDLENTPGYQFTLDQGLKGVQNSYASRGLGTSGAAQKGAARYATGLAQSTYMQQMEADLKQRQAAYNMLFPQTQTGVQAGGALANAGTAYSGQANLAQTQGAQATAAGDVGEANAWKSILAPLSQYGMLYAMSPDLWDSKVPSQQKAQMLTAAPGVWGGR